MLYKRSSFLKWLKEVKDCQIKPLGNNVRGGAVKAFNGPASTYIGTDEKDRIDYEEIYIICRNLYIDGLPGDSDLVRIE